MEVRYLGFDQLRNSRAFRFDVIAKGAAATQAVVTADMTLFLQFHIAIQDAPALCIRKLTADLEKSFEGEHVLTGNDLRAYSEARAAAEEKRLEGRRVPGRRRTTSTASADPRDHLNGSPE